MVGAILGGRGMSSFQTTLFFFQLLLNRQQRFNPQTRAFLRSMLNKLRGASRVSINLRKARVSGLKRCCLFYKSWKKKKIVWIFLASENVCQNMSSFAKISCLKNIVTDFFSRVNKEACIWIWCVFHGTYSIWWQPLDAFEIQRTSYHLFENEKKGSGNLATQFESLHSWNLNIAELPVGKAFHHAQNHFACGKRSLLIHHVM